MSLTLHQALSKGYHDKVYFAHELLGMPLHPGQERFLGEGNAKVNTLVPGNRWGKSVTVAIKHIHAVTYKYGLARGDSDAIAKAAYLTANLAPHSDATKPVFDAIKQILTSTFVIKGRDGTARANKCKIGFLLDEEHIRNTLPYSIPFTNRAQILFRSTGEDKGDSIQGKNFGYISYDEGGRSKHLEYELSSNILPRLGDLRGSLDIVSTPDQKSPSILFHYELFEKGVNKEPGYYSQEGDVSENIFMPETHVTDMKQLYKGDPILDQVLYGKFVFAGDSIFPAQDILAAKDESLNKALSYEDGYEYIVSVDTAMGEDEQVYTVLRKPKVALAPWLLARQISCKGNSKSPDIHLDDFVGLVSSYKRQNNLKIIIEAWNGESGRFCLDLPYDLQVITTTYGSWTFPGRPKTINGRNPKNVKKADIIIALRKMLAKGELKIPNESVLVKQLSIYRENDTNIPTDRVISLALACWLATDGAMQHNNEVIEVNW